MYSIENVSEDIYISVLNNSETYNHKSIVVVGDNASGKTTLIKSLLEKIKSEECDDFYFIDSLNRMVYGAEDRNQASEIRYSDFKPLEILKREVQVHIYQRKIFFQKQTEGL